MDYINNKIGYMQDFMRKTDMPAEAINSYVNCFKKITEDNNAAIIFQSILDTYNKDYGCDYNDIILKTEKISSIINVHKFTAYAVVFIAMTERLLEYYDEKGYSHDLFYHTMKDITYKTIETIDLFNVYGVHCPDWYSYFYSLIRFAFGNLQFEESLYLEDKSYQKDNYIVNYSDKALNIHLPKTNSKLDYEGVLKSYKEAHEFFKYYFEGKKTVFMCRTWLFFDENFKVLSENSNIRKFYNDFDIISSGYYEDYGETWRVFNVLYKGNVEELPENTSLQKLYKDIIKRGAKTGWAKGIFIYDR